MKMSNKGKRPDKRDVETPSGGGHLKKWENRIVAWEVVEAEVLLAHPMNFRRHPEAQEEALLSSLKDLGWIAPVIVNRPTGRIVDGHLRARLADEKSEVLPVAYVELSEEEEREALLCLDPIAAMAEVDRDRLRALLEEVGHQEQGIAALIERLARENNAFPVPGKDPGADLCHAEEHLKKWGVAPGQLWEAGQHRILCADATGEGVLKRLFAGARAQICVTDPPYNVTYGESRHPSWRKRTIVNDNLGEGFLAFADAFCRGIAAALLPGGILYMFMSAQEWPTIDRALRAAGLHWSSTVIWAKDRPVLSRKDYHTQYEPIWYGWREGAARLCPLTDRTQSDLWQIPRPARSAEHPTMKPVELVLRALQNSSRTGDVVFDPFLGSGTTAVAAEEGGRRCYGVEIEPRYVAVSLERLFRMGLCPRLIREGD